MTTPADNVSDAYFDSLWQHDEDVWTHPGTYIPRRLAQAGPMVPVHLRLRDELLRAKGDLKRILTGQVGAGKSTELHQLFTDQELGKRYEIVVIDADDKLNLARFVDVRYVLIAFAQALAGKALVPEYDQRLQRRADRLGVSPGDAAVLTELLTQLGD